MIYSPLGRGEGCVGRITGPPPACRQAGQPLRGRGVFVLFPRRQEERFETPADEC
jgi:hypothetical protein